MGIGALFVGFLFGVISASTVAMLGAPWLVVAVTYSLGGAVGTVSAAILALDGAMGPGDE